MSAIDDLVAYNHAFAHLFQSLGLLHGEAHMIRNAGGVVTDDVVRSLLASQRLLAPRAVMLVHHTDCGLLTFRDDDLKAQIQADVGIRLAFARSAAEARHPLLEAAGAEHIVPGPGLPQRGGRVG